MGGSCQLHLTLIGVAGGFCFLDQTLADSSLPPGLNGKRIFREVKNSRDFGCVFNGNYKGIFISFYISLPSGKYPSLFRLGSQPQGGSARGLGGALCDMFLEYASRSLGGEA